MFASSSPRSAYVLNSLYLSGDNFLAFLPPANPCQDLLSTMSALLSLFLPVRRCSDKKGILLNPNIGVLEGECSTTKAAPPKRKEEKESCTHLQKMRTNHHRVIELKLLHINRRYSAYHPQRRGRTTVVLYRTLIWFLICPSVIELHDSIEFHVNKFRKKKNTKETEEGSTAQEEEEEEGKTHTTPRGRGRKQHHPKERGGGKTAPPRRR